MVGKLRHIGKVASYRENWYFNLSLNALAYVLIVVVLAILLFDNPFETKAIQPKKFFSKLAGQGQNAAVSISIAIVTLS